MRLILCTVFATALTAAVIADQAGTIPGADGDIQITPIMRMSVQVEYAGKVIHVDPSSKNDNSQAKPADLVLITDVGTDSLDPEQIAKVRKPGAPVVLPAAAASEAGAKISAPTEVMANGETKTVAGISIEAVPAYSVAHGPKPGEFYLPKGRGNGYILTVGGKRIYFAGSTECTPEMKGLKDIDVAFLPLQMPQTMQPYDAGECSKAFVPKIVYIYHYDGSKNDEAFFRASLRGTPMDVRVQTK
jgi:L-ascorbate metabolism protein UlaG (beta-lactamase superfamily)